MRHISLLNRLFLGAAFLFFLTLWSTARAEGQIPLNGRIYSDIYVPTNDTSSTLLQTSASFWLEWSPSLGDAYGKLVFQGDVFETQAGGAASSTLTTTLREGYMGYAKNGWDLRMGKQIIPWGQSDAINPTDFLTAKDFTVFNPDEEVRRQGATGVSLAWTPRGGNSPFSFQFVWLPVFARTQFLIPAGVTPSSSSSVTVTLNTAPVLPVWKIAHSEFALKSAYMGQGWDVSLSFFRGWNHLPQYDLTAFSVSPATVTISPTFHKRHAIGSDFSMTWGKWILREELSYNWTDNSDGSNIIFMPSFFEGVWGVERSFWDDFRMQLQFHWRFFPNHRDPSTATHSVSTLTSVVSQIAQTNALLLGYQFKSRSGGMLRLSYSNEDTSWSGELFVLGYFKGGDYLLKPKVNYAWTDELSSSLGVDYYEGPANRPLGALSQFSSIYTELKYVF